MKAAQSPRQDKSQVRLLVARTCDLSTARSACSRITFDLATCWLSMTRQRFPRRWPDTTSAIRREVRLVAQLDERVWQAVVFGEGDWHARTEGTGLLSRTH